MNERPEVYYAIGGGLGHLSRALAVAYSLERRFSVIASALPPGTDASGSLPLALAPYFDRILTPPAPLARGTAGPSPARSFARWLQKRIDRLQPARLYLDAFPAGLFGEIGGLLLPVDCDIIHVARRLRWERYRRRLDGALATSTAGTPDFALTYLTEDLDPPQQAYLARHSQRLVRLELQDPPLDPTPSTRALLAQLPRPLWLVAHAGSPEETERLLAFAYETARRTTAPGDPTAPTIVLNAPAAPAGFDGPLIREWPACALFGLADRIFSGCGANTMRQTRDHAARHYCLPFARRFDDQERRAAERAGRTKHVATS